MNHHAVAYINADMRYFACGVSPLKENEVARLCLLRRNTRTLVVNALRGLLERGYTPELLNTQHTKPLQSKLVAGVLPPQT